MSTMLRYLDDSELYESQGAVVGVESDGESAGLVTIRLDQTIFYPQGGGQPTDKGWIRSGEITVRVERVSFVDGEVLHSGSVANGLPAVGDSVQLSIEPERRRLHARLHTGGHLVMTAVDRLRQLPAAKGYHFPDGPYVEFLGTTDANEREAFVGEIQDELDKLVAENSEVTSRFDTIDNLRAAGVYMPAEIPEGKPTRVVVTSGYQSPCGGTHVKRLGELQGLKVRGIKSKSGKTRVSYTFDQG